MARAAIEEMRFLGVDSERHVFTCGEATRRIREDEQALLPDDDFQHVVSAERLDDADLTTESGIFSLIGDQDVLRAQAKGKRAIELQGGRDALVR